MEQVITRVCGADLTETERNLMLYLWERIGEVVSADELLSEVWGYAPGAKSRTLTTTLQRVRKKSADDGLKILTVISQGVTLDASDVSESRLSYALEPCIEADPEAFATSVLYRSAIEPARSFLQICEPSLVWSVVEERVGPQRMAETAQALFESMVQRELIDDDHRTAVARAVAKFPITHEHLMAIRRHGNSSWNAEESLNLVESAVAVDEIVEVVRQATAGWFATVSTNFRLADQCFENVHAGLSQLPHDYQSDVLRMEGWCFRSRGRFEEAAQAYERAAEVTTDAGHQNLARLGLGLTFADLRDERCVERLRDSFDVFEEEKPEVAAWALVNLALFHICRDEVDAASDAIRGVNQADLLVASQFEYVFVHALIALREDPVQCERWMRLMPPGLPEKKSVMRRFLLEICKTEEAERYAQFFHKPETPWEYMRSLVSAVATEHSFRAQIIPSGHSLSS